MKTIEKLAEEIRHHINTDNAAKRLIVEHILPLIGMNFDSLEAATAAPDRIENLESDIHCARADLKDIAATLDEIYTEWAETDDKSGASRILDLRGRIESTMDTHLTAP